MRKHRIWLGVLLLILGLGMGITAYADGFSISQKKVSVNVGDSAALEVSGTDKSPVWTSYNENVAKVDKNGLVTGVSKGKVTVSARVNLDYQKCTVTVLDTGIQLNKSNATIYYGGTSTNTVQLKATTKGASKAVSWSSDDESVARVDSNGKVSSGGQALPPSRRQQTANLRPVILQSRTVPSV